MKCTVGHLTYNTTQVESIRDNRLFDLHYWLLSADSGLDHTPENSSASQIYNNQSERLAPILTEGLFFSKVFYSLILVDLGILSDRKLNPPLDPELLRYALNPINDFNRQGNGTLTKTDRLDPWKYSNIRPPNNPFPDENDTIPMREACDKLSDFVKPLGTQNATIYWQYSCQVPKKRSVATVALLVLVADFVLLQTAWMIMTFVADRLVSRKPQQCGVKGA